MYVMSPGRRSQVVFCHVTQVQRSAIKNTYEEWNGNSYQKNTVDISVESKIRVIPREYHFTLLPPLIRP